MPYPRELLNQGEDIVLDRKPHPWFMVEVAASGIASLVLLLVLVVVDAPSFLITIGFIGVCLSAIAFAGRYAQWVTTQFVVTTDRVIYRAGLFSKRGIEIPLENVSNIMSNQGFLERILGTGDLTIQSAGQDGNQNFDDVAKPFVVQNIIHAERENAQARDRNSMRAALSPQAAPSAPSAADELIKLAGLRDSGVLTEAEFEAQKARLLGQ